MQHRDKQCNLASKKSNKSGHAGPLCSFMVKTVCGRGPGGDLSTRAGRRAGGLAG